MAPRDIDIHGDIRHRPRGCAGHMPAPLCGGILPHCSALKTVLNGQEIRSSFSTGPREMFDIHDTSIEKKMKTGNVTKNQIQSVQFPSQDRMPSDPSSPVDPPIPPLDHPIVSLFPFQTLPLATFLASIRTSHLKPHPSHPSTHIDLPITSRTGPTLSRASLPLRRLPRSLSACPPYPDDRSQPSTLHP